LTLEKLAIAVCAPCWISSALPMPTQYAPAIHNTTSVN